MSIPPNMQMRPTGIPFQDMCTMLGLLTVTWAWAETSLAMTIGLIQEHLGSIRGHRASPVSLSKKMDCLQIALKDFEALHSFQQEASVLLKVFKELGKRRNRIVHGASWETPEGRFQAANLRVIGGKYAGEDHVFDIRDAHALNVEVAKLSDDMTALMLKIASRLSGVEIRSLIG